MATAVISAYEGVIYAHNLWSGISVQPATVGLLAGFAVLNIIGIAESALLALVLFVFHIATLTILTLTGAWTVLSHPGMLLANWSTPSMKACFPLYFWFFFRHAWHQWF